MIIHDFLRGGNLYFDTIAENFILPRELNVFDEL
jgi:hypothetical protein